MTAWGNIDLAVESIKRGARDFIQKPWENERLLSLIRVHAELHQALRRARQLELENRLLRAEGMPEFVAGAPSMQPVLELIAQVGPSDANVLITGEHGTGKEIVAKLLHAASPRSRMPLVAVNAGGLPEGTFESEIFGHVKGAFTDARTDRIGRFELANSGTLFLDEIANVPLRQQAKLLRVLETGELERVGSSQTRRVDVRVLSATNAELHEEATAGNFREDLLFRLNTVEIHLPALARPPRRHSAAGAHFLNRSRARYRKQVNGFSPAAMQQMMQYPWPGNVRELEHTVERAVLLCRGEEIEPANLAITVVAFVHAVVRKHEHRRSRSPAHPQGAAPLRRQHLAGRRSPGPEPRGALSPHRKIWPYDAIGHAQRRAARRFAGRGSIACSWRCPRFSLRPSSSSARRSACAPAILIACCLLLYLSLIAGALIESLDPAHADALQRGLIPARGRLLLPRARRQRPRPAWANWQPKSTRLPTCCRSSGCARLKPPRCWRAFSK